MFSMDEDSFIDKCLKGQATPEEIDDYIDIWHDTVADKELYEFLGMTDDEYSVWITKPSILPLILTSRKNNQSFMALWAEKSNKTLVARKT